MELKPCPFCGEPGRNEEAGTTQYYGCSDPLCEAYTIGMTLDEWNTRATSDLEKRLEEAEKQIVILEELNKNNIANWELQCKDSRNAALEEAAQVADGWDFGGPIAEEIRSRKEE